MKTGRLRVSAVAGWRRKVECRTRKVGRRPGLPEIPPAANELGQRASAAPGASPPGEEATPPVATTLPLPMPRSPGVHPARRPPRVQSEGTDSA